MAYTKRTWKYSGESGAIPISPANLNHIEDGIGDHVNAVTGNPHAVTAAEVGLGNVPNVTTNNQTPTYSEAGTLANIASGEVLTTAFGKIKKAIADFITHKNSTSNPHSVTAAQAGALPISGGTLTGDMFIKRSASHLGKLQLFKSHTTTTDEGTFLRDYKDGDLAGQSVGLRLNSADSTNKFQYAEGFTYYKVLTTKAAVAVTEGGTGATTAAGARNNLGLGNTSGALPVANGGTGATTAATARTNLGFITASGSVSVAANTQYADITVSGATTSKMVWINNSDAVVGSLPYLVSARITGNNTVRLYLNTTRTSTATVYYQVLIIG